MRDHDQGEVPEAGDDEARGIAGEAGDRGPDQQADERLAPAVLGDDAGRVGAEPEEGGMAERDDARIAEDQVEREREQGGDGDLAREHEMVREQQERQQRGGPERDSIGCHRVRACR